MECTRPLLAWRTSAGDIVFAERGDIVYELSLRCGQCMGCRLHRSREWATRIMHEAKSHEHNWFLTLTYDDASVPEDFSLRYDDCQKFMKRLRRAKGMARFFMCGEYGETTSRPHYHYCLFGVDFPDRKLFRSGQEGQQLFTSDSLNLLWGKGHCLLGHLTFESAAYVARYITKKVNGRNADEHYKAVDAETGEIYMRVPEFAHMSLKPGIGRQFYEKYRGDMLPRDYVISRGHRTAVPRYYLRHFKEDDPHGFDDVRANREKMAQRFARENTEDRLLDKERVIKAKAKFYKRGQI